MNECKLIGDVMPLFAEGLTSPETDSFVKEHLCTCPACRASFAPFVPHGTVCETAANGEAAPDEGNAEAKISDEALSSPAAERADTTPAEDKNSFVRLVRRRAILRLAAIAAAVAVLSGGAVYAVGLTSKDVPESVTADIPGFGELSGELTDTRRRGGDTTAFYTCADGSTMTYANGTLCSVTLAGECLIETGADGTLTEEECRAVGEEYVKKSLGANLDGYVSGGTRTTDAGREFVYTRAIDETHRGTVRFGVTFGGDIFSWSIFPNRELICPDNGITDPLLETELPGGALSLESLSGRTTSRICYEAPVYLEGTAPGKELSPADLLSAADRLCTALCGEGTLVFRTETPAGILDGTQITRFIYELPSGEGGAQIELLPDGGAVMWCVSVPGEK